MKNPKYSEWKATARSWTDFVAVASVAAIALLAALSKAQREGWPDSLSPAIAWLSENNWWVVLALALLAAVARVTRDRLDAVWIWASVQAIVDRIQQEAFADQQGYSHHHRATLFQYRKYLWWPFPARHWFWWWGRGRWPCSGWLIPVIRSGHTTKRSSTYFLAPDDADSFEGVAGHVWARNKEAALTTDAPLQPGAPADVVSEYASKTFISETMAQRELSKGKVLSASFKGVPIEGKGGQRWGVLVLDSREASVAVEAKLDIGPYAYCLGKLLERI